MNITVFSRLALLSVLVTGAALTRAAEDQVDAATKARIAQFDQGPATIDISSYPAEIQKDYAVFHQRCTLCHTLARPINSDFSLPDEWSRYVKRMMHKPGSEISAANAKKIYTFLVYDSSVRKKSMVDAALAKLSPADRADQEAKVKAVHDEQK